MAQEMTFMQHMRAVLVLGTPLVASQLAQFSVQITDTIMLGWYGLGAQESRSSFEGGKCAIIADLSDASYPQTLACETDMTIGPV